VKYGILSFLTVGFVFQVTCMEIVPKNAFPQGDLLRDLYPLVIHALGGDYKSKINFIRTDKKSYQEFNHSFSVTLTRPPRDDQYPHAILYLSKYYPKRVDAFFACAGGRRQGEAVLAELLDLHSVMNNKGADCSDKDDSWLKVSFPVLNFYLTAEGVACLNSKDRFGNTLLHHVVENILCVNDKGAQESLLSAVRFLVEKGKHFKVPLAAIQNNSGDTPIHYLIKLRSCCKEARLSCLSFLLHSLGGKKGLFNIKNKNGDTFLHLAIWAGVADFPVANLGNKELKMILDCKGVDPNCVDGRGRTPADCMLFLMEEFADDLSSVYNKQLCEGLSLIFCCPRLSYWERCKIFIYKKKHKV